MENNSEIQQNTKDLSVTKLPIAEDVDWEKVESPLVYIRSGAVARPMSGDWKRGNFYTDTLFDKKDFDRDEIVAIFDEYPSERWDRGILSLKKIKELGIVGGLKLPTTGELDELIRPGDDGWRKLLLHLNKTYEFLTDEYVNALGTHVEKKITDISALDKNRPITVLELGAGQGMLSWHLK